MRPEAASWLLPGVKAALLLAAVAACRRARARRLLGPEACTTPPPPPTPAQQARAEFEAIPADYAAGTSKLYSRGDFMAQPFGEQALDEGDFIGRLRTLFGPQAGNEYVLRDKKTGYVITGVQRAERAVVRRWAALLGALPDKAPGALLRGAMDRAQDHQREVAARIKADPLLAKGPPQTHPGEDPQAELRAQAAYTRRFEDAAAGPELAAAVARLNHLLDAVAPADWEKTEFDDEEPGVYHIGVEHGHSFDDELPAHAALAWLLDCAEKQDPKQRDALGGVPFEDDLDAVTYYRDHAGELADARPRVAAAFARFVAAAKTAQGDLRDELLGQARTLAHSLQLDCRP